MLESLEARRRRFMAGLNLPELMILRELGEDVVRARLDFLFGSSDPEPIVFAGYVRAGSEQRAVFLSARAQKIQCLPRAALEIRLRNLEGKSLSSPEISRALAEWPA